MFALLRSFELKVKRGGHEVFRSGWWLGGEVKLLLGQSRGHFSSSNSSALRDDSFRKRGAEPKVRALKEKRHLSTFNV